MDQKQLSGRPEQADIDQDFQTSSRSRSQPGLAPLTRSRPGFQHRTFLKGFTPGLRM
jgi:hypothetical protein